MARIKEENEILKKAMLGNKRLHAVVFAAIATD